MASIIEGYNYDIFISYRQKDNKGERWVSQFVEALRTELESTFKEEISVYFDINLHDGLLETHDVDESLKEKLNCLVFIPIISRTYCDLKSFAWENEFKAFVEQASKDDFGLKVRLPNGNVASRILPVIIHDLDMEDMKECESILGSVMRGVEFIYKEQGVNRPLTPNDDAKTNLNNTNYRNQINKASLAIREVISGLAKEPSEITSENKAAIEDKPPFKEKSIIVLPFENISPDPEQEYFSDGLTEEIITDLSHIHDLLVISRSSAMTFKGTKKKIREIASDVNVRYVLEGSVRKAGNNLRITAQLIDANSDMHLWAEKYNGTLDDIFNIQEKVSKSIVDALKLKLSPKEKQDITERPIENVQAYEYYLRAKYEIDTFTEEGLDRAIQYLETGREITGENALLYAGFAYTFCQYYNIGKPKEYLDRGLHYARKALEFNPESSEGHFITGALFFFTGNPGDLKKVIFHFKRALAINPNNCEVLFHLEVVYNFMGKTSAVAPLVERHLSIDPYSFYGHLMKAMMYLFEGKFDMALEVSTRFNQLAQGVPPVQFFHALILAYNKRLDDAYAIFNQNQKAHPENIFSQLGVFLKYALQKDKTNALQSINSQMLDWSKRDFTNPYYLVLGLALIDEKEETLNWLEEWVRLGCVNYPLFNKDPFLENIREEERFIKLVENVKHEWENFEV